METTNAPATTRGETTLIGTSIVIKGELSCGEDLYIVRRVLASHERSLVAARGHSEPAGQIAAREMEIVRIRGVLQRAEELGDDVASAIERAS